MTDNTKPNVVDELIDVFDDKCNEAIEAENSTVVNVLRWSMEQIQTNRPALEAGLRGVLRFKIYHMNKYKWNLPFKLDLADPFVMVSIPRKAYETLDKAQYAAQQIAQSLGLTAVFVEDES